MTTRVTVTVELSEDLPLIGQPRRTDSETLTWEGSLSDDNPRYSAKELDAALAAARTDLVNKVVRLRGDIRVGGQRRVADTRRLNGGAE